MAITSGGAECSESVRRALLTGLFVNVAEHVGEGKYKMVGMCVKVLILCKNFDRYKI